MNKSAFNAYVWYPTKLQSVSWFREEFTAHQEKKLAQQLFGVTLNEPIIRTYSEYQQHLLRRLTEAFQRESETISVTTVISSLIGLPHEVIEELVPKRISLNPGLETFLSDPFRLTFEVEMQNETFPLIACRETAAIITVESTSFQTWLQAWHTLDGLNNRIIDLDLDE
ncbi:hypothetical protein K9N68_28665 [Kovacikia minuta CCNUW1]|uniref:hypothetical protein n=1 Tax=Kovacikia minuta TaxID=2931930 RepID=UPI001CCCB55F|nr:hypothetical protein [Kovacikia minuta]UBF25511.1 hypothetical protein K9N68_28665 [Kovacikia minuta CCNUW1]